MQRLMISRDLSKLHQLKTWLQLINVLRLFNHIQVKVKERRMMAKIFNNLRYVLRFLRIRNQMQGDSAQRARNAVKFITAQKTMLGKQAVLDREAKRTILSFLIAVRPKRQLELKSEEVTHVIMSVQRVFGEHLKRQRVRKVVLVHLWKEHVSKMHAHQHDTKQKKLLFEKFKMRLMAITDDLRDAIIKRWLALCNEVFLDQVMLMRKTLSKLGFESEECRLAFYYEY